MLFNETKSIFWTVIITLLALSSFPLSCGDEIFSVILELAGICDGTEITDNKSNFETAITEYLNEALICLGPGYDTIDFYGGRYYISDYRDVLINNVTSPTTTTTTGECKVDVSLTAEVILFKVILYVGGCSHDSLPSEDDLTGSSFFPFAGGESFQRRLTHEIPSAQPTSSPSSTPSEHLSETINACQDPLFLSKMDENGSDMINGMKFKEITMLQNGAFPHQGNCGEGKIGNGVCADPSLCCSEQGWCGTSPDHCGNITPLVSCGYGTIGNGVCADPSLCCSLHGWCGTSPAHCYTIPAQNTATNPTTTTTTIAPQSNCGYGTIGNGVCANPSLCCSEHGWCGTSPAHCGGIVYCGYGTIGNGVCANPSLCCSVHGWCGTSPAHCN